MRVVEITSDTKYAKLTDDVVFTIKYDETPDSSILESQWFIYYSPDIIFKDRQFECTVEKSIVDDGIRLKVVCFSETLKGLSLVELRNVGCFTISNRCNDPHSPYVIVVQTYSENEINVVLERSIEQAHYE